MQQSEGANTVHTPWWHMLQESAEKLVGGQGHRLAAMVAAVAVGKGYRLVIAVQDGLVGHCGAMHVATKVLEYALWALDGFFGERYPALVPRDLGKLHCRQRASSQRQESPTESFRESSLRY
jgi:hypothetical protein